MAQARTPRKGRKQAENRTRDGAETVLAAAIKAFAERGYHGTSVRDLAERQGLSVAALYYHFPSKEHVLVAIMTRAMDDLIQQTEAARDEAPPDPISRLAAIVRALVLFHTERQAESFVGNSEIRSLDGKPRSEIIKRRDYEERIFREVIQEGTESGDFAVSDLREVTRAVIAMCVAVHTWYREGGQLSPDEIADAYAQLALQLLGAEAEPVASRLGL